MWNVLGVCLGALAVLVSISLHELGHLVAAKAVGMTATRFFVGFGPTVWSVRRRGTEYGLKAVPLGGFVSIAGMNAFDDDADHPNAMWRFPAWRRTVVMAAGPAVHIAVGFVIFWGLAATLALPNPANLGPRVSPDEALTQPAFVSVATCLDADSRPDRPCAQPAPAWQAGLREGDRVTRVGDRSVTTYGDLAAAIRSLPAGQPVSVAFLRGGATRYAAMTPVWELRAPVDDPHAAPTRTAVVGLGLSFDPALPRTVHHNVFEAAGIAGSWVGIIVSRAGTAVTTFPRQVAGLWHAVSGGHRDPQSPVSVVGVSRISGQLLARHEFPNVLGIIAGLNIFLGLFNLLPLVPLDGGHIAVTWLDRLRWGWPGHRRHWHERRASPRPKVLLPLAYVILTLFVAFSLLDIAADIVNPINVAG